MLTRLTKGQQVTIPATLRKALKLVEGSLIDIELDRRNERLVLEPVKKTSLQELFDECDKIKRKTNKSVRAILKEYEEQMFH